MQHLVFLSVFDALRMWWSLLLSTQVQSGCLVFHNTLLGTCVESKDEIYVWAGSHSMRPSVSGVFPSFNASCATTTHPGTHLRLCHIPPPLHADYQLCCGCCLCT